MRVKRTKRQYLPVIAKFKLSHAFAMSWMIISMIMARNWVIELGEVISLPVAIAVIAGIAFIPGYMMSFMFISLILDKQPRLQKVNPNASVTILIAALNEEQGIRDTLRQIHIQQYDGRLEVILIDNGSTDRTIEKAEAAAKEFGIALKIVTETKPGKHHALNRGLT